MKVGLPRAADQLNTLISEAVSGNISPHIFLDRLLEEEQRHREERRIRTSLVLGGLPTGQTGDGRESDHHERSRGAWWGVFVGDAPATPIR